MQTEQPIGIFDSGVGGISIWKEIVHLLPYENTIYLADSKHAPYGQKSKQDILDLSIKNTELLLEKGCKLVVAACNTATTNAISYLREHYDVSFIGIEPAIKPAALQTKTNAIGILATKGTLTSELFHKTSVKFTSGTKVIEQIGEGLVPLIEGGKIHTPEMEDLLHKYLDPMLEEQIDCLVLGCSHYPFLIPQIREIVGNDVTIIDSGQAVARQTKAILEKNGLLRLDNTTPHHKLYCNTDVKILKEILIGDKSKTLIEFLDF